MHILAYIDPGAGALIWQSVVGVFVGLVFYLRRTRKWVGRMAGKVLRVNQSSAQTAVALPMEKGKAEADPQ
jgi:hypothetical protein